MGAGGSEAEQLLARAARVTLALLLLALVVALAIGGRSQEHALGDVPGRMLAQGIHAGALPYVGWNSEYPVAVGIVQWLASLGGGTPLGFLLVTSAFSAALALALVALLVRETGARVWFAILSPAFVLYGVHNWDLLALVPAVAGVLAFDDDRDATAGTLIAFGACAKVFPAVFLPPLIARRVHKRGWTGAVPIVAAAVGTTLVLNVPFALGSRRGWAYPFRFQGRRPITWGTLWSVPSHLPMVGHDLVLRSGHTANLLSGAALLVGTAVLCVVAVRRNLSAVAIGAAATGLFLIVNKVYSPNYDIWLVPWLALLPVARRWRVALGALTTAVFVVVFGYFHASIPRSFTEHTLPFLVVGRAVAIGAIVATAVAGTRAFEKISAVPGPQ